MPKEVVRDKPKAIISTRGRISRAGSGTSHIIVGLDIALKRPFHLVGESEMACFGVFYLLEIYVIK
jgi:hypothetical protein